MKLESIDEVRRAVVAHAVPAVADEVYGLLSQAGAILKGHFALQSGSHSDHIFRIRGFARHPEALARLGDLLVERSGLLLDDVTLLCPESAGYLLAAQIAQPRSRPLAVAKVDLLRRPTKDLVHGSVTKGSRVVIVNDVASTGSSIDTLCELARARGATVEGVLLLATSQGTAFRAHLHDRGLRGDYLLEGRWTMSRPEVCPQCLANDRKILPVAEFN